MIVFDKSTGLAVTAFQSTDASLVKNFKKQFTNHWFYEQSLSEIERWHYDGNVLTEREDWESIKAEIAALQDEPMTYQSVSVINFKLAFSAEERVAIKNSTDPLVQDFYELVNDHRVNHVDLNLPSVQDSVQYLETIGLIVEGRTQEILNTRD